MNAVVKFNNYLVSNSNKYGYYEIESFIHPNLDEKETLICTRYWRKSFWFITPESKEDIEKLEAAIKNNFKDILKVGEFANAEWDSNVDCLSEEYDCSNIKSLSADDISKITYNLNQEEPQEWLSQNDWKSCGCESFFEGTLIISLEKQDE